MTYSVKVENGVVVNRIKGEKLDYIQNNEAQIGWTYDDGVFSTPATETEEIDYPDKDVAIQALVDWADSFTETVTGPVPKDEKLSWDAKEASAIAYLAGTASSEQKALLQGEADLTGETLTELSTAVITRATVFRTVVSKVAGLRRKMTAEIEAETDPNDYSVILENGKNQALTMAAALGL